MKRISDSALSPPLHCLPVGTCRRSRLVRPPLTMGNIHVLLCKWTWRSQMPRFDLSFCLPGALQFTGALNILYESERPQVLLPATGLILPDPRIGLCIFLSGGYSSERTKVTWGDASNMPNNEAVLGQHLNGSQGSNFNALPSYSLSPPSLLLAKYIFSPFFYLVNISFMFVLKTLFPQFSRDWCL